MAKKKTTEQFVIEARQVHGEKWNYDESVYSNAHTKLIIGCLEHGNFKQEPHHHLAGGGCPKCARRRKTTEQFIAESRQVHGNKWNYDKTDYVESKTKLIISCPKHGDFKQIPNTHLRGSGCPKCGKESMAENQSDTTSTFIEKAKRIHGDSYSYELVDYEKSSTPVTITCPKHGNFEQRPNTHLLAHGCPKCANEKLGIQSRKSNEDFIKEARELHDDVYDYSQTSYITAHDEVLIICHQHGGFWKAPNDHLAQKQGCPKCSLEKMGENSRKDFISLAKQVHRDRYCYEKTVYKMIHEKVVITCRRHGDFTQIARTHLRGYGCPVCRESTGEGAVRHCLEDNQLKHKGQARFASCRNKNPLPFDFMVKTGDKSGFLIEYQGGGHYFKSNRSRNNRKNYQNLLGVQFRDHIKLQWCRQHNIPFIIIPFWDLKRIPEILDDVLAGRTPTFSEPPEIVKKNAPLRQKIRDHLGITEPEVLCGLIKPETKQEAA